jgi:RES domain-containing protein
VTLRGWRIVPENQAATAFDGEGARLYGGRWNSVGVAMVYTSEHQSLAALEVRVHINTTKNLNRYKCFAFEFDEKMMKVFPDASLPKDWQQEPPPASLQRLGDAWVRAGESAILAVPSVIIPNERNFLLNPGHPDFGRIKRAKSEDFAFDPRLLR